MVTASAFLAYFSLLLYCDLVRPVNPGFIAGPTAAGHVVVTSVVPGKNAAATGIEVDDRILSFNGATIVSPDAWSVLGTAAEMAGPLPIVVERDGHEIALTMTLEPAPGSYWWGRAGVILLIVRAAQFAALLAGIFVLWRRPTDLVALTASWFLMTCGVFTIALPWRIATVWREVPMGLGLLMFIPYASGLTIGPLLLTFVAAFPRRLPYAGYVQAATWVVAAPALAVPLFNFVNLVYGGGELGSMGPGTRPLFLVTVISLAASVIIFTGHYRHIEDLNERRKLRAVLAGIATAVFSAFPVVAWFWYQRQANLAQSLFESPALALAAVSMLSLPLSMTYVVLRHRVFDISFIIRQGLRYALARRLLLSLLPALIAILALDVLAHGHETLHTVLRQRGPLYAGVSAVALAVYMSRQRWLDALDRRFFRERQNGYAVLREVAEHLRKAGSLDRVAPRVVATIESAMHPEFAALLAHARHDAAFRTIAAAPAASAMPDLSADSKLVALARVFEQPIDTSGDGDAILRQLPAAELEFVTRCGLDLLIPVMTPDNQLYGLLALGRKRSEEPYSTEDKNVLVTIAENVALLAAKSIAVRESPPLEECPECGACFDDGVRICDRDSRPLVSRALPRTLTGR
jgi:GAF domain-containing protein